MFTGTMIIYAISTDDSGNKKVPEDFSGTSLGWSVTKRVKQF